MAAEPAELAAGVLAGDRRALARAVTLVESTRPQDRVEAVSLVEEVYPRTGRGVRIGLSGPPGVGKSTLIDVLGLHLVEQGHRVAVLAVDPSSSRSGGSILGDKTRMTELARHPNAFVRPSPSGGELGGVARRTREARLLFEAAGYDVVIIETVGVGQSEIAVADMVDTFLLLVAAGGGDELQGVKRGIMELADLIAVTKADGDLLPAARRAEADYRHAVRFLRHRRAGWEPEVLSVSAEASTGIRELWHAVERHRAAVEGNGGLAGFRIEQELIWLDRELEAHAVEAFRSDADFRSRLAELHDRVGSGKTTADAAVLELFPPSAGRR